MRSSQFSLTLSLPLLLLPFCTTALPQDAISATSSDPTTTSTSTSTSTLTVTRTLIRGTAFVTAHHPEIRTEAASSLPAISSSPSVSPVASSDLLISAPYPSNTGSASNTTIYVPSATGTGVVKPSLISTGPPAVYTGGAAVMGAGAGGNLAMMGIAVGVGGWAWMGAWL